LAKKVFPLLRTEFRIAHGTMEMVYLPVNGDSFNAPREGIEGIMSITLYIKCVARMVDIGEDCFGGNFIPGE